MIPSTTPGVVHSYRARRRLEMAPGVWREPGELVPEAGTWVRVDAWLHGGHLERAELTEKQFLAAIRKHCPQHLDTLRETSGLTPDVILVGPHGSPQQLATPPELIPLKKG